MTIYLPLPLRVVRVQGCLSVPDALPPDQLGALRELLTEMQIKCVDGN